MNPVRLILAAALAALAPWICAAHEHGEQWSLANEYPATSLPGEGDELFAKLVARGTQDGRLAQNYARMRENGMTIDTAVPAELGARLREAARDAIEQWARAAGPEGRALLERR